MNFGQGVYQQLPRNRGGGVDVRAGQLAARSHVETMREYRERVDRALQFKALERQIRRDQKLRDEAGYLLMSNDGNPRFCATCSDTTTVFRPLLQAHKHRHEDSAGWRNSVENNGYKYPCHTCKLSYHTFDIPELNKRWTGGRIPVFATSSTLYNWQGARHRTGYEGDPFHVERVAVAGATVRGVAHAIAINYFNLGVPIDVLLCAGINDIISGSSAFEVTLDYAMLQEALSARLPSSTLSICTLPLPPKLVKLPGDRTWRPRNFTNKLEVLVELNSRIVQFNKSTSRRQQCSSTLAPTFHTRGLRTRSNRSRRSIGPRNLLETVVGHRFSSWREAGPHKMLHLNETVACSMGKATIQFFRAFYHHMPHIPRVHQNGGNGMGGEGGGGAVIVTDRSSISTANQTQDHYHNVNVIYGHHTVRADHANEEEKLDSAVGALNI